MPKFKNSNATFSAIFKHCVKPKKLKIINFRALNRQSTENGFLNATIFSIKMNMRACRIQWGGWGLLNFLSILNLCIFRIKEAKNLDKKVSAVVGYFQENGNSITFLCSYENWPLSSWKHKHITPTLKVFWCESHSKALWMKITKKSHWERSELH